MADTSDDKNHILETRENNMEMKFTLPAWRMNEIVDFAVRTLCEAEFYADNFSYRQMISSNETVKVA